MKQRRRVWKCTEGRLLTYPFTYVSIFDPVMHSSTSTDEEPLTTLIIRCPAGVSRWMEVPLDVYACMDMDMDK